MAGTTIIDRPRCCKTCVALEHVTEFCRMHRVMVMAVDPGCSDYVPDKPWLRWVLTEAPTKAHKADGE